MISCNLCLLRPYRVRSHVNLGVAFVPRKPSVKLLGYFRHAKGKLDKKGITGLTEAEPHGCKMGDGQLQPVQTS